MTKANGKMDKRKSNNHKHYVYTDDHYGKTINIDTYNNVRTSLYIPDSFNKFNTVQLTATMWVKSDMNTSNYELNHTIAILKKKIHNLIREWKQPYFRNQSIVFFKIGDAENKLTEIQYLLLEIVFYVNPLMIYDKTTIKILVEPLIQGIIDDILPNETFEITKNKKMEARILKKDFN